MYYFAETAKFDYRSLDELANINYLPLVTMIAKYSAVCTNFTLRHGSMLKLLSDSSEQFDVIILETAWTNAMLGLAHHFRAPIIGTTTLLGSRETLQLVGVPMALSYVPHLNARLGNRMTFLERLQNVAMTLADWYWLDVYLDNEQRHIYEEVFAQDQTKPSYDVIKRNVALQLVNSHFSFNYAYPKVPNLIDVAGLHLKSPSSPLPSDIQQFIDDAGADGVIYMAWGSKSFIQMLPDRLRDDLIRVLSTVVRQKVLIKWEGDEMPQGMMNANIMAKKWFPQQDVLASGKVRVFITHGGLNGLQEAIYHAVPVVGIPIFGDAHRNMVSAELNGYGVHIYYNNLTELSLRWAIDEVLNNERYAINAKLVSERFRDQQNTPMETAIYWVEYIVRHKGAPHLRVAALDLSIFVNYSLDVIGFVAFSMIFVVYVLIKIVKRTISFATKNGNVKLKSY